ncbi:MAG: hypothetical protein AB203_01135 [Parcubacteria bacterium C7867-008]|nr:MAG: hypothetical protein AB203_01135 [Parcubacteria bacterium C7867-008]
MGTKTERPDVRQVFLLTESSLVRTAEAEVF